MPLARISKAGRENIAVGHHGKEFGLENKVKWKKKKENGQDRTGDAAIFSFYRTRDLAGSLQTLPRLVLREKGKKWLPNVVNL